MHEHSETVPANATTETVVRTRRLVADAIRFYKGQQSSTQNTETKNTSYYQRCICRRWYIRSSRRTFRRHATHIFKRHFRPITSVDIEIKYNKNEQFTYTHWPPTHSFFVHGLPSSHCITDVHGHENLLSFLHLRKKPVSFQFSHRRTNKRTRKKRTEGYLEVHTPTVQKLPPSHDATSGAQVAPFGAPVIAT